MRDIPKEEDYNIDGYGDIDDYCEALKEWTEDAKQELMYAKVDSEAKNTIIELQAKYIEELKQK